MAIYPSDPMNNVFAKLEFLGIEPIGGAGKRFPATQADIEHLQDFFGFRFPPIYAQCVLRYGMSGFDNSIFYPVPHSWDEETDFSPNDVRVLYGIDKPQDFNGYSDWDLGSTIRSARYDLIPSYLLPICESDGLATVNYISCREQDYGNVYALTRTQIWDRMNGIISPEDIGKAVFHIASSFEHFVDILEIMPD